MSHLSLICDKAFRVFTAASFRELNKRLFAAFELRTLTKLSKAVFISDKSLLTQNLKQKKFTDNIIVSDFCRLILSEQPQSI